jgi:hypothetical protein
MKKAVVSNLLLPMGIISACFSVPPKAGTRHPLSCKLAKIVAKKKKSVFFYGFDPRLHPTTI